MRTLAAAMALALCAGCAHYKVVAQSSIDAAAVRGAPAVAVAPLGFATAPVERETPESWAKHLRDWSEAFRERVEERAYHLGGRPLAFPAPGATVPYGALVTTVVRNITKGDFAGYDEVTADVTVIDAQTRAQLLVATVTVKNNRGGWENYTFGGRVKLATINLADAVVDAIRFGYLP